MFIQVPRNEREQAKQLGAQWGKEHKPRYVKSTSNAPEYWIIEVSKNDI